MSESPEQEKVFAVAPTEAGERLDRWLTEQLDDVSRSQVQSWIKAGRVHVDGETLPARHTVTQGQTVTVRLPNLTIPDLVPVPVDFGVVGESDEWVVVDKPSGLQVHPGSGPQRDTLVHGLLHRYKDWQAPGPPNRPGIVHRLDRLTSGLLVVARTPGAFLSLGSQIRERTASRRYIALVWGEPTAEAGRIDAPIGRSTQDRTRMVVRRSGRPAATSWRVIGRFEHLSLLEVTLETGRTHQIRVHMKHIGHPIFADPTYGRDAFWLERVTEADRPFYNRWARRLNRQALHAYHLSFSRPEDDQRVRFEAPVPQDMDEVLLRLTERGMSV